MTGSSSIHSAAILRPPRSLGGDQDALAAGLLRDRVLHGCTPAAGLTSRTVAGLAEVTALVGTGGLAAHRDVAYPPQERQRSGRGAAQNFEIMLPPFRARQQPRERRQADGVDEHRAASKASASCTRTGRSAPCASR